MRLIPLLLSLLLIPGLLAAQSRTLTVIDTQSLEPVAFATLIYPESGRGQMADIQGKIALSPNPEDSLIISGLGYRPRLFSALSLPDTVWLSPRHAQWEELTLTPAYEKIRRLIHMAIAHKPRNNPEEYPAYQCRIYYKMTMQGALPSDTLLDKNTQSSLEDFIGENDLLVTESYTHRIYQKPGRTQETVLASRISGFKKSPFAHLITEVLPFHAYDDFIVLNGKAYGNPLAKGWEKRYEFSLAEQWTEGADSFFVLPFWPKKAYRNQGLRGQLVICSRGYAITRLEASSADTGQGLTRSLRQVYESVNGRWFPRTLEYRLSLQAKKTSRVLLELKGFAHIDSVEFVLADSFKFQAAYPVQLHENRDSRTEAEWAQFRPLPLSPREEKTLSTLDSLFDSQGLEPALWALGKAISRGLWPIGPLDIDLYRLGTFNRLESIRAGMGLYTNEKISSYFSLGGWAGYGVRDQVAKYGADLRIYPRGHPDHRLHLYYSRDYRQKGHRFRHPELQSRLLSTFLFFLVDEVEGLGAEAQWRLGYFDLGGAAVRETIGPGPPYVFEAPPGAKKTWERKEARMDIRYAFREMRLPAFGQYLSRKSEYPIAYFSLGWGTLNSGSYRVPYTRSMAALKWEKQFPRWGKDSWIMELGGMRSRDNRALPASLLLSVGGERMQTPWQIYSWEGMMTVYPYEFFCDQYLSLGYKHMREIPLFHYPLSSPQLGVSHRFWTGSLNPSHLLANPDLRAARAQFHESAIIVDRLLRFRYLDLIYVQVKAALLFPWRGIPLLPQPPRLGLSLEIE